MAEYTAKLTGNRRDISTGTPKALLIMIDPSNELERTHCWVELDLVETIQPRGHQKPRLIRFQADKKEYKKRGIHTSYTLTNIREIELLRYKR